MRRGPRLWYFVRVVIAIALATILLLMLLLVFFPDVVVVLAWEYSDQLPRPFSWGAGQVHEAILLLAVVCWVVPFVLVAWFQLRSFRWRGFK